MSPPSPLHIVVIGAGVIGLQTAVSLLEAGYRTTLVAEFGPRERAGEYTSPWAGAHWRTHARAHEPELQQWDTKTYRAWMSLAQGEEKEKEAAKVGGKGASMTTTTATGLGIYTSYIYWADPIPAIATETWWQPLVDSFTALPPSALPPNTAIGLSFKSLTINVPIYLVYLLERARTAGCRLLKARLPTEHGFGHALGVAAALARKDGLGEVDAFVNATGLGARALVGDARVYPTRGQTVLVKGEAKAIRTSEGQGYINYVLPRKGGGETVLGGTKEDGNWDTTPNDKTTAMILAGCKGLAPELLDEDGNFEVLAVPVGLRPSRQGGPRLETEVVDGKYAVVHSYGHAGAGYQNSLGSARKVVRLIDELGLSAEGGGRAKL